MILSYYKSLCTPVHQDHDKDSEVVPGKRVILKGEIYKHNLTTPLKNLLLQGQTLPVCPANTGDAPGQTLAPAASRGHAGKGTAVCSSC